MIKTFYFILPYYIYELKQRPMINGNMWGWNEGQIFHAARFTYLLGFNMLIGIAYASANSFKLSLTFPKKNKLI